MINHACRPNARVDFDRSAMVSITAIAPGEEITFNYLTTEMLMAETFHCGCGAPHCPGTIAGFEKLTLKPLLSSYLTRALESL